MTPLLLLLTSCPVLSLAGLDLEGLISLGYTCSLAERLAGEGPDMPGVETVCDDGVCSQCVKTAQGIKPWLVANHDLDVEDFLQHGFVCSLEFRDSREAHNVCDDGLCVGCMKPHRSLTGGQGDVERFLERGYKCFQVRDVPDYALADRVEVVCDDGECFGCMKTGGSGTVQDIEETPLSVDEMLSLGYTCSVKR